MLFEFAIAFGLALVLSLLMTPWIIRLAIHVRAIDQPNERKVHSQPTPRLGGLAIYLSFFFTFLILRLYSPVIQSLEWAVSATGLVLLAGCAGILILGVWDDVRQLGPGVKFLVQVLVSTLVYLGGISISSIGSPFGTGQIELGVFSYPATVLWIVAVMNALNLIDGLDGLSSGVAFVASLTMCAISFMKGDPGTALIAVVLGGALLGFLRFNFNPARIFLGDSGSLFLGFVLAVLSILGSTKGSTAFAMAVPALALGLPLMDTILAMVRRGLRPFMPETSRQAPVKGKLRSIFMPDKDHIHHRLLALGLSQRHAVLLLYVVASALGCTAYGLTMSSKATSQLIVLIVGTAVLFGIRSLRYREMSIFRNGVLLNLYNWKALESKWLQIMMDAFFVVVSYGLAWHLAHTTPIGFIWEHQSLLLLIPLLAVQILALVGTGVYKSALRHSGVAEALCILKAVFLTLAVLVVSLGILWRGASSISAGMLLLYFYFVSTLLMGARFSFLLLRYWYEPADTNRKKILIYGADAKGLMALQYIRTWQSRDMVAVGFLDDDPALEGKKVYGHTVYGGHWKVGRLRTVLGFDEIMLANDDIKPEVMRRLRDLARMHRIAIRRMTTMLDDVVGISPRSPAYAPYIADEEVVHVEVAGDRPGRLVAHGKEILTGRDVRKQPMQRLSPS